MPSGTTASRSRVDDVIFSLDAFKKHHPQYSAYYRHVTKAEKTGEREVTFTFDSPGNRELPQIVGQLNVLPKHWWEGTDKAGKKRDVAATTLEPPLGCGAYRSRSSSPAAPSSTSASRTIGARTSTSTSAAIISTSCATNISATRPSRSRPSRPTQIDWRTENSAKNWATAYDFPAVKDKRVLLEEFPINCLRRDAGASSSTSAARQVQGPARAARVQLRVRFRGDEQADLLRPVQAHRQLLRRHRARLARICRQGTELAILETVRDKVPPEVFTKPYTNPVSGSAEAVRANLREASRLLREAGYEVRDQKLVNAKTGEPLTVEFCSIEPDSERFVLFYKPSLERLGITVTCAPSTTRNTRTGCAAGTSTSSSRSGASRCRPATSSAATGARRPPTRPARAIYVGIKNPAVDALIERVIFAKDRAELVAATKALDRVLLWNHYVVPQWTYGKVRSARWDRFGRPDQLPKYGFSGVPDRLVVGRGQGGQDGIALVIGLSRRDVLIIGAGAVASGAIGRRPSRNRRRDAERHGISVVRRSEISGRLSAFRLRRSERPEGRRVLADRPGARCSIRTSSPSIRSTATSCAATPRRAWS